MTSANLFNSGRHGIKLYKVERVVFAIIEASVVFPQPGGPQNMLL